MIAHTRKKIAISYFTGKKRADHESRKYPLQPSWLAGDVKEPTRLSQRVGNEVPGVVVWPLLLSEGWGENARRY